MAIMTVTDYTSGVRILRESPPIAGMTIAAACALALSLVVAERASPMTKEACTFEQTWYKGDQHYWETLELRRDMTGRWTEGGMGGDAPIGHIDFQWRRTDHTFTAVFGSAEHTVDYQLERRGENTCRLTLRVHPFDADRGVLIMSDSR
ncbi:MAG: hypothetical protein ABI467_08720 [Kofleriaceae bacterium]